MNSAVLVTILLVAMATTDAMTTTVATETTSLNDVMQNSTELGNSSHVTNSSDSSMTQTSDDTDDDDEGSVLPSTNDDQFKILNGKLTELTLQLELLATAVDKINLASGSDAVSGRNPLSHEISIHITAIVIIIMIVIGNAPCATRTWALHETS